LIEKTLTLVRCPFCHRSKVSWHWRDEHWSDSEKAVDETINMQDCNGWREEINNVGAKIIGWFMKTDSLHAKYACWL